MDNYDFYASKIVTYLPLAILVVMGVVLLLPNSKKKFLRLQASLPTSKIKSIAKGVVEIQGKLKMNDALISPVAHEKCIGYHYIIEDVSKNKDGKYSYSTIHRETKCNTFTVQDETGTITIEAEGIEFVLLQTTNVSSNNSKRYSEILIKENQEVLLVGYADANEGVPFIRKDENYKVLGITSATGISVWNKYQPLLKSFLFTCVLTASLIALILSQ